MLRRLSTVPYLSLRRAHSLVAYQCNFAHRVIQNERGETKPFSHLPRTFDVYLPSTDTCSRGTMETRYYGNRRVDLSAWSCFPLRVRSRLVFSRVTTLALSGCIFNDYSRKLRDVIISRLKMAGMEKSRRSLLLSYGAASRGSWYFSFVFGVVLLISG
jgi:hypothetical protein